MDRLPYEISGHGPGGLPGHGDAVFWALSPCLIVPWQVAR